MIPLLAAVLAIVLVVALWRLLDPKKGTGDRTSPTTTPRPSHRPLRRTQLPPDDNPEFLRELGDRMNERPTHGGSTPKQPGSKPDDGESPSPAV